MSARIRPAWMFPTLVMLFLFCLGGCQDKADPSVTSPDNGIPPSVPGSAQSAGPATFNGISQQGVGEGYARERAGYPRTKAIGDRVEPGEPKYREDLEGGLPDAHMENKALKSLGYEGATRGGRWEETKGGDVVSDFERTRGNSAAGEEAPEVLQGVIGGVIGGTIGSSANDSDVSRGRGTSVAGSEFKQKSDTAPPTRSDKNGWYQNTYLAGAGSRESLEKAVSEGILVDGKRIKLESFTGTYKQDFPFPEKGALGLTVRADRSKILPEGGSVFLEVGLQAASQEGGDRPDLNVVLVFDRSGSMKNEGKIEAVKAAAKEVVDRLSGRDQLAIVTYSSDVTVVSHSAPVKDKAALKSIIDRIEGGGGTNIYAGLEAAYAELEKTSRPDAGNLALLLTDGKITAGQRDERFFEEMVRKAADNHIETSSIGMGITYNEDLMMRVARAGAGNYHFIKDATDVPATISSELDDLAKSIARGVRLRVVLPETVSLVRVMGSDQLSEQETAAVKAEERKIDQRIYEELGIQKDRDDQNEPGVKMLIPSFKANDAHVVLMELWVPPGKGALNIAEVHVKYKDMLRKTNDERVSSPRVEYAPDKASSVASINRSVKKNILGFQTGEALMAASSLVARGAVSDAVKRIDDQMVLMGVAAREWKDKDLERDAMLLGQYKDTLVAYGRQGINSDLAMYLGKSFSYSAYQRLK